ncbi:MAG TPA: hypothetical protein VER34_24650 [Mycobacterium sp.]|nr:hypothetical protein [Mycobacterium sp.]
MNGQQTVRRTMLGRLAVGLLAVAAVGLLAPVAAATPQDDADAAITAAWQAAGGDTGLLGPKDGGVYPAGEGFGQDFPGGKIFFTPATGAHIMTGAILDKYMSLGGPADGDLGFPTIDEGAGKAPDSRNTTFSAADNPVIFWTPDTGARVVRGPINAAWDKLDGSAGPLGVPSDDEAYRGNLVTQKFTGGEVTYDRKAKAFTTVPPELAGQLDGLQIPDDPASAINAARRAAGGPLGPLGAAQGEPYKIGADGLGQNFAGGKIFYSPSTGANVVTGQVLAKYESVGGPQGDLGFPTASEVDGGLAAESRITSFAAKDEPVIFWTPDYGAVIVRGAMNAAWQKLGGATGSLGAPMADQAENGDVITQRFSGGVVSYDRSKKTFSTEPANLAPQLAGLQVPGQEVPKAPPANQASDTKGHKWFTSSWLWVLAIVPVLILAGLVAVAALRNRRRGREDALVDSDSDGDRDGDEFGHGGSEAFGAVPTQGQGAETADDDATEVFSGRYAREGVGSPPATSGAEYSQAPMSLWEPPEHADEADTTREPVAAQESDDAPQAGHAPDEDQEDPDSVDTAPTRVPTPVERDPLTDTGRHARIEVDEPAPNGTAMHLPLDDPNEAPEGYPVKADTKSGLYWVPGTTLYDDARAEVWFVSEELARTNGFVRAN